MVPLVGLAAGGHSKVLLEILRDSGDWDVVGLLDQAPDLWESYIDGVQVLGDDSILAQLYESGVNSVFIGLGSSSDTGPRRRLYEKAVSVGVEVVSAIHPRSVISPSANLGKGVNLMALAVVNPHAYVGDNVIINTGAIVEHDCVIGDHCHVASGSVVASGVTLGAGAHIGAGSAIRQGIHIGTNAVVGAGSVVVKDVPDNTMVVGVPARFYRKIEIDSGLTH